MSGTSTDTDAFGRCKWCGNLTDSAGCLNLGCAAQSAKRADPMTPSPDDAALAEALLQVRDLALGATLTEDHERHVQVLADAIERLTAERDDLAEVLDLAQQEAPVMESNTRADERAALRASVRAEVEGMRVERGGHLPNCARTHVLPYCNCGGWGVPEAHNAALARVLAAIDAVGA